MSGAILKTFDTKIYYGVAIDASGNLRVFKNAAMGGGSDTVSTVTPTTVHGSGTITFVHAKMDSVNGLHVVSAPAEADLTRTVAYRVFDTTTDTWAGAWEEIFNYTETPVAAEVGINIDIDSSNYPHIFATEWLKVKGVLRSILHYSNRTGGSWSTLEQVMDVDTYSALWKQQTQGIAIDGVDDVHVIWFDSNGTIVYDKRTSGTWGTNDPSDTVGRGVGGGTLIVAGVTPYMTAVDASGNIYWGTDTDSLADTGYDEATGTALKHGHSVDHPDGNTWIVFVNGSDDIQVISYDGTSWVNEATPITGTITALLTTWQYNHNSAYRDNELAFLFSDGANMFSALYDIDTLTGNLAITHV